MTPTSLSTRDAGWIIFILALGAGFSVASIYYAQPLLPLMGANLHLTVEGMGLVPTLTQAGYALGILFLLPLGDRHDRRRLIPVKSALLALLLLLCSLTGQLSSLLVVSLLIGMAATMAQDIVPAAAIPPRRASRENGGHGDDRAAAGDPALPDGQRRGGRRIRLAGDVSGGGGQRRADWPGNVARPAALRCALDAELSAADGLDGASVAALPGITPRRASSGRALHRL